MIKRGDLYNINNSIDKCLSIVDSNLEFNYFLAKLDKLVKDKITDFEKIRPVFSDKYTEYLNKKNTLIDKYAIKDDNNNIKQENGYTYVNNVTEFTSKYNELNEEYKEDIDLYKSKLTEFINFMELELTDVVLPTIKKEYLPLNIQFEQLRYLTDLIIE
jgi:hypothetical protein